MKELFYKDSKNNLEEDKIKSDKTDEKTVCNKVSVFLKQKLVKIG